MAVIDLDITPLPVPVHFAGYRPGNTFLPRARIDFEVDNVTIAAKIATNETAIRILCTLPQNYAYVMDAVFLSINANGAIGDSDSVTNFQTECRMEIDPGGSGQASRMVQLFTRGAMSVGSALANSSQTYEPSNLLRQVFFNTQGASPDIDIRLVDFAAAATAAGVVNAHISVYQYDIEQAFFVSVNAPTPVRSS